MIPAPTPADMERDAERDYNELLSIPDWQCKECWIRRAVAAEAALAERSRLAQVLQEICSDVDERTLIDRLVAVQGFLRHGKID